MAIAGRHFYCALELEELRTSVERLKRSEALQRALFAISDLAGSDRDTPDMLHGIIEKPCNDDDRRQAVVTILSVRVTSHN